MMKILQKNFSANTGFSIVEVIVAALIFAIAASGFYATVINLNRPAESYNERTQAAFIGKRILEDLRNAVDAQTWNTNEDRLSLTGEDGNGLHTLDPITVGNITFTPQYQVIPDPDTEGRKVVLTINWI